MTRVEVTHSAQTGGMTLAQIEAWCTEARNKGIPGDTVPTIAMRSTRQLRLLSASALAQDSVPIAAAEVS
jgi:hypothetical protein